MKTKLFNKLKSITLGLTIIVCSNTNILSSQTTMSVTSVASSFSNCSTCIPSLNTWSATIVGYQVNQVGFSSSKGLHLSNFNFNIPTNAVIVGVKFSVGTYTGNATSFADTLVKIIKNGAETGINKSLFVPFSFSSIRSYGGNNDMWGTSLTPADINSSNFGVSFAAALTATGTPFSIFVIGKPTSPGPNPELTIYYQLPTGLSDEANLNFKENFYPNPTNGALKISASTAITKLYVSNALGQTVLTKTNINATNTSLDLSTLPVGIYLVQLQTKQGTVTKKIIKE